MTSFADLGLHAPLLAALDRQGITEPFPIQLLTIADALAGKDVCGKAKTGSGKTLAFGLPLLQKLAGGEGRPPRGLILVPTRELARQVSEVLEPLAETLRVRVAAFYGGAAIERQVTAAKRGVDVVVATPGRLIDLLERKAVSLTGIEMVVVDEADRMADMGFLPQVEWIMRKLGKTRPQALLFSATLDGQVDVLVRRYMHDPVRHEVASTTATVDDMTHRFLAVHQMDRVLVAAAIARGVTRTLLFVRTKRGADNVTRQLAREGVRVAAIHGDLRQNMRERALESFSSGKLQVLVATDVAARGIHVDNVDVVLHYDPPDDQKAYVHRSGRTARAGQAGIVVTFVLWNQQGDVEKLQKRLALREPVIEVFSNDPRLADLASLTLAEGERSAAS